MKTYVRSKQHKIRLQNINQTEQQHKYRLGTISKIKTLGGEGGLNRLYRRFEPTSIIDVT